MQSYNHFNDNIINIYSIQSISLYWLLLLLTIIVWNVYMSTFVRFAIIIIFKNDLFVVLSLFIIILTNCKLKNSYKLSNYWHFVWD